MREIRVHGQDKRYSHPRVGINGRLDTIQAAILLAKFDIFPDEIIQRERLGNYYTSCINSIQADVITPQIKSNCTSVYAQYSIVVDNRDELIERLKKSNVPTAVHYPTPLHLQNPYYNNQLKLPIAEYISKKIVSLPMHPYLKNKDIEKISQILLIK